LKKRNSFFNELFENIIEAVSEGYSKMIFIGINMIVIQLLGELNNKGLINYIQGIVDDNENYMNKNILGITVHSFDELKDMNYDTIIIPYDSKKEEVINKFLQHEDRIIKIICSGSENYLFSDMYFEKILASCSVKPKSGGYPNMLVHIYQSLEYLSENRIFGDIVEFGTYQGGTTVFMAKVLQHFNNPSKIFGFDTFSGFPPKKSSLDMFNDKKYQLTDFNTVQRYCSPYNIELIKGDICETCEILKEKTLSFAFFDTDNYSATKKALETCYDLMITGGIFAFDHYYSPGWIQTLGERLAIKQVLKGKPIINFHETGIFIKMK